MDHEHTEDDPGQTIYVLKRLFQQSVAELFSVDKARFRRRSTHVPNLWWIKYGKRAASESIWYGSFSLVRQKR